MANDCYNYITIRSKNKEEILKVIEFLKLNDLYEFTDYNIKYKIKKENIIEFRWGSKWRPNYEILEEIVTTYKGCVLKNIWEEEGGVNGIFLCEYDTETDELRTQKFCWLDMCIEEQSFYMGTPDLS
jgi:uncharacterized membrane protein YfhO